MSGGIYNEKWGGKYSDRWEKNAPGEICAFLKRKNCDMVVENGDRSRIVEKYTKRSQDRKSEKDVSFIW
jgi:hypothetical protein